MEHRGLLSRRKLAYHAVRRAFQPSPSLLPRRGGRLQSMGSTTPFGTGRERSGMACLTSPAGCRRAQAKRADSSNCSTRLAELNRSEWEVLGTKTHGAFALLEEPQEAMWPTPAVSGALQRSCLESAPNQDFPGTRRVIYSLRCFVWGATIDLHGESSVPDNCFDLIPGIPYAIPWEEKDISPEIRRTGNRDDPENRRRQL